jgi:hypothetical protein
MIVFDVFALDHSGVTDAKASSVPGRTQTAVLASSEAANPLVPVLKLWVVSLSPTLASGDAL